MNRYPLTTFGAFLFAACPGQTSNSGDYGGPPPNGGAPASCSGVLSCPLSEPMTITLGFGELYRDQQRHLGVDVRGVMGTDVKAACSGSIVHTGMHRGYGSARDYEKTGPVVLQQCDDALEPVVELYGHCAWYATTGRVTRGQSICKISFYEGDMPGSDWSHLHWGARTATFSNDALVDFLAGRVPDGDGWAGLWVNPVSWAAQAPSCTCVDADGDGRFQGACNDTRCPSGHDHDCDDHDPSTYPGAPELADYRDNNCDGHVDEPFRVTLTRLFHSNGLDCSNPSADFDHCFSTASSGSCVGTNQGGGSGYGADGQQIAVYAPSLSTNDTAYVGPNQLTALYSCYLASATEHYMLPADHPDYPPAGWTCSKVGFVRTGSIIDSTQVGIHYHYAPKLSDRMFSSTSAEGASCGYADQGTIFFAWN